MIVTLLFFLLFRKILISVLGLFFAYFLFLLQKDFCIFHVLFFEAFLCFCDNIYLPFSIYTKKRYIEKIFVILVFFKFSSIEISSSKFSSSEFFYWNQRKFLYRQQYTWESPFLQLDIYINIKAIEDNHFYLFYKENRLKLLISNKLGTFF